MSRFHVVNVEPAQEAVQVSPEGDHSTQRCPSQRCPSQRSASTTVVPSISEPLCRLNNNNNNNKVCKTAPTTNSSSANNVNQLNSNHVTTKDNLGNYGSSPVVSLNSSGNSVDTTLTDDSFTRPLISLDSQCTEVTSAQPAKYPQRKPSHTQQLTDTQLTKSSSSLTSNGRKHSRKHSADQHVEFDCSRQPSIRRNGTWLLDFETSNKAAGLLYNFDLWCAIQCKHKHSMFK